MLQENTAIIEGLPGLPGLGGEPQIDWSDGEEEEPKKMTETRVCSLCYWNPTGAVMESPIINVATIKECSRYEKRGD